MSQLSGSIQLKNLENGLKKIKDKRAQFFPLCLRNLEGLEGRAPQFFKHNM